MSEHNGFRGAVQRVVPWALGVLTMVVGYYAGRINEDREDIIRLKERTSVPHQLAVTKDELKEYVRQRELLVSQAIAHLSEQAELRDAALKREMELNRTELREIKALLKQDRK